MTNKSEGGALSFLKKESIVAEPGYNRWKVPPASIAIHMCIGSVYAWSLFNAPLTRELGVVTSSADDWSLFHVVWKHQIEHSLHFLQLLTFEVHSPNYNNLHFLLWFQDKPHIGHEEKME